VLLHGRSPPAQGKDSTLGDRLLVVNLDARGRLLLQTVWQVAGDAHGRRRTDIEAPANLDELQRRLAELVPLIAGHLPKAVAEIGDDLRAAAA